MRLEQKQQERRVIIAEMNESHRAILQQRRARSQNRKPRDLTIDDLDPLIIETVVGRFMQQLQPVFDNLARSSEEAGESLKASIEKMIEPLIQGNDQIVARVKAALGTELTPTPPTVS